MQKTILMIEVNNYKINSGNNHLSLIFSAHKITAFINRRIYN